MERLNDIYLELLQWLQYEGKPSDRIWHPLFYRYPWGLRFELGVYELDDTAQKVDVGIGGEIAVSKSGPFLFILEGAFGVAVSG